MDISLRNDNLKTEEAAVPAVPGSPAQAGTSLPAAQGGPAQEAGALPLGQNAAGREAGPLPRPEREAARQAEKPPAGRPGRALRRMLYRWLAWMLLLVFFCCVCSSLEMAIAFAKDPRGVLEGRVTAVPAYRGQVARLGALAMQAAAHPPAEDEANELLALLEGTDSLLCFITKPQGAGEKGWPEAFCAPLLAEDAGRPALPAGYTLLFGWQTGQEADTAWATFLGRPVLLSELEKEGGISFPSFAELGKTAVLLAGRDSPDSPLYQHTYTARRWQLASWLCCGVLALALLLFLYTAVCAKDVRAGKALVAGALGRVWLEAKLCAAAGILLFLWRSRLVYVTAAGPMLPRPELLLGLFCFYLFWADLSLNGAAFFRCSLCAAALRGAAGFCRRQPWQRRVLGGFAAGMPAAVGLAAAAVLLERYWRFSGTAQLLGIACGLGALAVLAAGYRVLARLVDEGSRLAGKLADLRAGRSSGPLTLPRGSLLAGPAEDLSCIEEGIARAVEERSRADRMKVELITNVSHDIKTPLTSILSYADLLCAEPGLPPSAAEYARILQQKAAQLRSMVQDVFELSKAASGNLPLNPAPLDLAKLIWQTLADMDEKISASLAEFKVHLAPEAWVTADGDKLYRVFQNLFANAAQYSLPGSRVYVTLAAEDGRALASVKNVANYEMGFDPAEITERFVRGDPSRTTEGSGLGLSIARSFAEACGGSLDVRVDADLFCVSVALPLTARPEPEGNVPAEDTNGQKALAQPGAPVAPRGPAADGAYASQALLAGMSEIPLNVSGQAAETADAKV